VKCNEFVIPNSKYTSQVSREPC